MTPNRPPRIPTWILKHFGCGSDNEALLGDLAEQHLQRNSALWYWRQTLKAIPVSFLKEIRGHKQIAVRALLTGWVMWILSGALIFPLVFFGTNIGYAFEPRDLTGSASSFMWMPVLGYPSWHGPVSFIFATVLPLIVGVICGWLVVRWQISARRRPPTIWISPVHGDQKTGVVLLFAGSILLIDLLLFGPFVLHVGTGVAYSLFGRLAANVAASVLGIVLGGGLLGDRSRTA